MSAVAARAGEARTIDLDAIHASLDELGSRPVGDHVSALTTVLDALVEQLDDLARQLSARG